MRRDPRRRGHDRRGERGAGRPRPPGAVAATTGAAIDIVTADAGYAYAKVFAGLEDREIDAVIPAKAEQRPGKTIPTRRFRLTPVTTSRTAPEGRPCGPREAASGLPVLPCPREGLRKMPVASALRKSLASCPRGRVQRRSTALLRARRRRLQWGERKDRLYSRHRWRAEGFHGEARTWHGLARAVRRGLDNIRIQAFLTAAAVNLKRLATALGVPFLILACLVVAALRQPWMAKRAPLAKSTAVGACAA